MVICCNESVANKQNFCVIWWNVLITNSTKPAHSCIHNKELHTFKQTQSTEKAAAALHQMSTRRHCDQSALTRRARILPKQNCKLQTMLLLSPHNYTYKNAHSSLSLMIMRLDLFPQYRKFRMFHLFKVSSGIHQWADIEVQKIVVKDGCLLAHCSEILNLFLTFVWCNI